MVRKLSAASSDDEDEDEDDADGAKTQDWSFELIYHAACASVTARRERGCCKIYANNLFETLTLRSRKRTTLTPVAAAVVKPMLVAKADDRV